MTAVVMCVSFVGMLLVVLWGYISIAPINTLTAAATEKELEEESTQPLEIEVSRFRKKSKAFWRRSLKMRTRLDRPAIVPALIIGAIYALIMWLVSQIARNHGFWLAGLIGAGLSALLMLHFAIWWTRNLDRVVQRRWYIPLIPFVLGIYLASVTFRTSIKYLSTNWHNRVLSYIFVKILVEYWEVFIVLVLFLIGSVLYYRMGLRVASEARNAVSERYNELMSSAMKIAEENEKTKAEITATYEEAAEKAAKKAEKKAEKAARKAAKATAVAVEAKKRAATATASKEAAEATKA